MFTAAAVVVAIAPGLHNTDPDPAAAWRGTVRHRHSNRSWSSPTDRRRGGAVTLAAAGAVSARSPAQPLGDGAGIGATGGSAGELEQKPSTAGGVGDNGSGGSCVDGSGLDGAAANSDAVVVFDRCGFGTGLFCVSGAVTGAICDSTTGAPLTGARAAVIDPTAGLRSRPA